MLLGSGVKVVFELDVWSLLLVLLAELVKGVKAEDTHGAVNVGGGHQGAGLGLRIRLELEF